MTSIISSNHYVAKLEINLHIINFCHDYFMLCDTEISAYKGVLPVKTDRVSSGINNYIFRSMFGQREMLK